MPTQQVGDGPDFSPVVTGHITLAEGSFDPDQRVLGRMPDRQRSDRLPGQSDMRRGHGEPLFASTQLEAVRYVGMRDLALQDQRTEWNAQRQMPGLGAIRLSVWRRRSHPVLALVLGTCWNQLPGAERRKLSAEQRIDRWMVSVSIHQHRTGLLRRQRGFRHGGAGRTHHLASQSETHGIRRRRQRRHDR
jgi:hypothetical protein